MLFMLLPYGFRFIFVIAFILWKVNTQFFCQQMLELCEIFSCDRWITVNKIYITNGYVEDIFRKVLHLSKENLERFHSLLERTDLSDVVHFASQVAEKIEFLDFLHELTY